MVMIHIQQSMLEKCISKKDYKSLQFFGAISVFLLLVGAVLFVPVFLEFIETGLVDRVPTLIVSGLAVLSSLLSLSCGLILDTIVKKEKQNFEVQMNLLEVLKNNR